MYALFVGLLVQNPAPPPPTAAARAVAVPPVIDGRLNDPAWLEAAPITGFI